MRKQEMKKWQDEVLSYMTLDELKENVEAQRRCMPRFYGNPNNYQLIGREMVQNGCFACYYWQCLQALERIYGDEYKESVYVRKDGELRWLDGECYCWRVYKSKMGQAIEKLMEVGLR